MFIGHYGASFAAKRLVPRVSLGWYFLAVQLLDVLFATFVLTGVEKLRIVPGFTAYNPYNLYFMPYTHGLAGALVWSMLTAVVARALLGRECRAGALLLGACVLSHWVLDLPMHTRDMPLVGNDSLKVGFGLWRHRGLSLCAELVVFGAGAWFWLRGTGGRARGRGAAVLFLVVLAAVLLSTPFMPAPKGPNAFAVTALIGYAVLALAAAGIDRLGQRQP